MKSTTLNNYLNEENIWTKRLLGLEDYSVKRTVGKVLKEYDQDKWAN